MSSADGRIAALEAALDEALRERDEARAENAKGGKDYLSLADRCDSLMMERDEARAAASRVDTASIHDAAARREIERLAQAVKALAKGLELSADAIGNLDHLTHYRGAIHDTAGAARFWAAPGQKEERFE